MGCCQSCFACCITSGNRSGDDQYKRSAKWSLVYRPEYNISFLGLEKLHPFDSGKWGKVYSALCQKGMIQGPQDIFSPPEVTRAQLAEHASCCYIRSLPCPCVLAAITELPCVLAAVPPIGDAVILKAMRFQTGGTILAVRLALMFGWAINIGGGFHHASLSSGSGFCAYPDISLAILEARKTKPELRVLIVDLDAHQGNGHERDFQNDPNVQVLDMFNAAIFPGDEKALTGVSYPVPLSSGMRDSTYLALLKDALSRALGEGHFFHLIVFNAGTDLLYGDPLGSLKISAEGVVKRDEMVFKAAMKHRTPIAMVTSGGYTHLSAEVITASILNLKGKKLIWELGRGSIS